MCECDNKGSCGCGKDYWGFLWYFNIICLLVLGITACILSSPPTRVPYAVITSRNCSVSPRITRRAYRYWDNSTTSISVNSDWYLYPFYGICPAGGVRRKCVSNCQSATDWNRRLSVPVDGSGLVGSGLVGSGLVDTTEEMFEPVPADELEDMKTGLFSRILRSTSNYRSSSPARTSGKSTPQPNYVYNYINCIDFSNFAYWADMDNQNFKNINYVSKLEMGAKYMNQHFFPLMATGCLFLWIGIPAFLFVIPMTVAWCLYAGNNLAILALFSYLLCTTTTTPTNTPTPTNKPTPTLPL